MVIKAIAITIALFLSQAMVAQLPRALTLEHVSISQVVSKQPRSLEAYLDVRAVDNSPIQALPSSSLTATLDGKPLPVQSLTPFGRTGQGVGYVFLVDISGSESQSGFAKVKQALQTFVDHMEAVDRAAIITFGAQTATITSYTADKALLERDISGLVNNSAKTQLNQGLIEGLAFARRLDAGVPTRRSIVVLSDGKDEGSGFNDEDVLRVLEDSRVPIYAVGASNLPENQKARYLEVLHRYALLSGGAFYDTGQEAVQTAYAQIHDRIMQMWVADLDCSSCVKDGRSAVLRMQVTRNAESLDDKVNVTYAPLVVPPSQCGVSSVPPKPWWKRLSRATCVGAAVALFILLAGVIALIVRRKKPLPSLAYSPEEHYSAPGVLIDSEAPWEDMPAANSMVGSVSQVPLVDKRSGLLVELMRRDARSGSGGSYSANLVDRLVVGRSSDASMQIPDPSISGRHCELEMVGGRVCVSDLGSTYGTFLNGVPVKNRQRLESGDILALGQIEFRFKV